ncbi:site-specific integrase, partial [Acidobacteria bacterium AH-259-D05]|nr:site-specific integrase [Acidobacteria bacterium AH-259-D05]
KRKQKWFTVKGPKVKAEEKLTELLHQVDTNQFVEPSKMTFGEWLDHWVETAIKSPKKTLRTYETYVNQIRNHLKPHLGSYLLQNLDVVHLENYYKEAATRKEKPLSQTTLQQHHAIISGALKSAERKKMVRQNAAKLVDSKPKSPEVNQGVRQQCWTAEETRRFLAEVKKHSTQDAAFYSLALDTLARKGELCGLKWENVDLDEHKVTIVEQLLKAGPEPVFGPPKRNQIRVIRISEETTNLLRKHKRHQAELKMKNRSHYHDYGLMFAREWGHRIKGKDRLGHPLSNVGQGHFKKAIKATGIHQITFHGLRHTGATLALSAGVPVKVVSERLGHKGIEITMNIYQHVLPDMQEEAAVIMGNILHAKNS